MLCWLRSFRECFFELLTLVGYLNLYLSTMNFDLYVSFLDRVKFSNAKAASFRQNIVNYFFFWNRDLSFTVAQEERRLCYLSGNDGQNVKTIFAEQSMMSIQIESVLPIAFVLEVCPFELLAFHDACHILMSGLIQEKLDVPVPMQR